MDVRAVLFSRRAALGSLCVAALWLAAGCGSGGDPSNSGSDEDYVATICRAQLRFQEAGKELQDDLIGVENEAEAVDLLLDPLNELLLDFREARPPPDAAGYHETLVAYFQSMVAVLEAERSVAALQEFDDPPLPPDGVSERLEEVAIENDECLESGFRFAG